MSDAAAARVVPVDGPDPERHPAIREAAEILRGGGLVAFPTETVYGLGADATSAAAVDKIFAVKGRPADNPLIVHVAAVADLGRVGLVEDPRIERLLRRFWPGPLTVVIPARELMRSTVCRGLETVAVRMPAHAVALALIRATGRPLAAPSANLSGRPSPTAAEHVAEDLGDRIPLILDGGPCAVGIESTVLDLSGGQAAILRPGAVLAEEIAAVLEAPVSGGHGRHLARSPGTRHRHYRPRAPVVLIASDVPSAAAARLVDRIRASLGGRQAIGYLAARPLSSTRLADSATVVERGSPESLTRHLYADLRRLDQLGVRLILVEAVAESAPVMDRLRRASALAVGPGDVDEPRTIERIRDLAASRAPTHEPIPSKLGGS